MDRDVKKEERRTVIFFERWQKEERSSYIPISWGNIFLRKGPKTRETPGKKVGIQRKRTQRESGEGLAEGSVRKVRGESVKGERGKKGMT